MLLLATQCVAANYYVSPTGLDTNAGTTTASAWQTLAHVNAHTFSPGDTIFLQRGGTWSEPLIPPSSGASGSPISFDAYGTGAPPVITAAAPNLSWTYNSGNVWQAQLPAAPAAATVLNMQFGSLWGQYKAPSGSCMAAGVIVNWRDFCAYGGYVYVYDSSPTNAPAAFYGTTITPIVTVGAGYQLINISGKTWLTLQHLKLQNFDNLGVIIWGGSDNLVFANMEVDGQVPYSTNTLGFYFNVTGATSIKFYNVDAHLNYDGWKITGTTGSTSAISLVNCSAFGNRDAAIVDNVTGGSAVVTYSHFYGNGLSTLWSQDVQGVAGPNVSSSTNIGTLANISLNLAAGQVPNYVDPKIVSTRQYAAWDTFTVDDVGLTLPTTGNDGLRYENVETYVNRNVLPVFNQYGLKFNAAVVTGYSAAQGYSNAVDTASVQNWFNLGQGINSHSWSHQYFIPSSDLNAFTLLYNGTGTATISGNVLSTAVSGGTGSSISGLNLTVAPYNEIHSLVAYLNSLPGYTAVQSTIRDVPHTVGLADVAAQSIGGTPLQFLLDTGRMENDEMTTSMAWLNANIAGLTLTYYVMPDGQETNATQGYALTAGYTGERGELSMGGALGMAVYGSNEVASVAVGVMNTVSFGMAGWKTNTAAQMDAGIDNLIFRQNLWGYPVGLFIHMPDLTSAQMYQVLAALRSHGATVKLNTELRDWMLGSWTVVPNTTPSGVYYQLPQSGGAFSAARSALSPDIGKGQNLGAPYNFDINGVQRTGAWDIGAYQFASAALGGGTGGGYFTVGSYNYAVPQLPLVWVNNNECKGNYTYELQFPGTWISGAAPSWPTTLPYANTAAGYQQALNDVESYRTLTIGHPGTRLDAPAGAVYSQANGFTINQSSSTLATQCNVLASTGDAFLPDGTVVGAHGIQDNVPASTDIGLINPDLTGNNLAFQLGTTVTPLTIAGVAQVTFPYTLANGTVISSPSQYNDLQYMFTLEGTGTNPPGAITFCNPVGSGTAPSCTSTTLAPDHWLIMDMEARCNAGNITTCTPINLPEGTSFTATSQIPSHNHLRKDWGHGDWASLTVGRNLITDGISLTCIYCSFVDSQISEALRPGQEGHSIQMDGQEIKIDHNWLEGSSSCMMIAGYALTNGPGIFGYVPGTDLEFRRNRCTFPYQWLGQMTIPSGNTQWSGSNLTRKNCMEQKELNRALFDGYIAENSDNSGGQSGVCRELTTRNDAVGFGQNYQSVIQNVTDTNAIWRNSCRGPNLAARSSAFSGDGGGASFSMQWIMFSNDLSYDVTTSNPGCSGVNSTGWAISSSGQQWTVSITENAAGTAATAVAVCSIDASGNCPAGPINTAGPIGFQAFDIRAGDPVTISGCTGVPGFNMPTQTVGGHVIAAGLGPLASAGSGNWTGTFAASNVTVTYPWTATASASDSTGTCILTNVQGGPSNLIITHHTWVSTNAAAFGGGPAASFPGSSFSQNFLFRDSIIASCGTANTCGWYNSVPGTPDGTKTQQFDYDVTSMTVDHLVWPQRTAANYTEYCSNPNYPDTGKCTAGSPPTTFAFPATPWCTGATPTSACVGWVGSEYKSASSLVLAPADYHDLALDPASSFHNSASDLSDYGANIPAIDAAQTLNTYSCGSACGSAGPYPDH